MMIPSVTSPTTTIESRESPLLQGRSDHDLQVRTEQVSITVFCNSCKQIIPKTNMCGRCRAVYYCSTVCQKEDWPLHKLFCSLPKIKLSLDILTPFKSNMRHVGNQEILVYSLDPSFPAPKNTLFELSDFAEMLGSMAMEEFVRQMRNKIQADSKLKNTLIPVGSAQILKLYTGPLNGWIKEAELDGNLSILTLLSTLKTFVEKYFNQPGHEALKVDTGDLIHCIRLLHEEMVISLWLASHHIYPDYTLKNVCQILKSVPQNMILEINCIAFAFLMTGEKKFEIDPHSYLSLLLKNLDQWNYCSVTEPQKGDFVVYFDAKNEPKHIGVLTSSGKVCSKPGLRYPFSVEQPLSHISILYGKGGIAFFRKKT